MSVAVVCQMLEDYSLKATDLLLKLDILRDALSSQELPDSVATAKVMLEGNVRLRRRVAKAPVDVLEVDARHVIERIYGSPSSARDSSAGKLIFNTHTHRAYANICSQEINRGGT